MALGPGVGRALERAPGILTGVAPFQLDRPHLLGCCTE